MARTFAFLDLETTGLPCQEANLTRITEICIVACSVEHMRTVDKPRVIHKLSVCVNPKRKISSYACDITGLNNILLANDNVFDANTSQLIACFLAQLQQPVCLVAHNGMAFDYPILKAHLTTTVLPDTLLCCDSLHVFRQTQENCTKFSQSAIYNRMFQCDPPDAHTAEGDVLALMKCAIADKSFIDTSLRHIYPFSSVVAISIQ